MKILNNKTEKTLRNQFYQPLEDALEKAVNKRECTSYSDSMFLHAGVGRVIEAAKSGRAWVQHIIMLGTIIVSVRNFFLALSSKRRFLLLSEVNQNIREQVDGLSEKHDDPFNDIPELAGFHLYASDGHSHGASA
jgi:hypothetical protein